MFSESVDFDFISEIIKIFVISAVVYSFLQVQTGGCPDLTQDMLPEDLITSTPAISKHKIQSYLCAIEEGSFFGVGKHKDGSDLGKLKNVFVRIFSLDFQCSFRKKDIQISYYSTSLSLIG